MQNLSSRELKTYALEFLQRQRAMVIATASREGEPHAAAVYYIIDENFDLYFMTAKGSRKYHDIIENPRIAFTVSEEDEVAAIQGGGAAKLLQGVDEAAFYGILEKISVHDVEQWPILRLAKDEGYVTFGITPTWMVWFNLDKKNYPDIARDEFYKII